MGKHRAAAGASVHPIVADALTARSRGAGAAHSVGAPRAEGESDVGWPAPPVPGGGGRGWPGDLVTGESAAGTEGEAAQPVARRRWRRLLGSSRAA